MVSFPQVSPPEPCAHLFPRPYLLTKTKYQKDKVKLGS